MMKRTIYFFLAVASLLAGAACDRDDLPSSGDDGTGSDDFYGSTDEFTLGPETADFPSPSFTLALEAPDGSVIKRDGSHMRHDSRSRLSLSEGLADGVYRLLYLEYPIEYNPDLVDLADQFKTTQFGLGSRIEIADGRVTVLDHFNEELGLPGLGTAEEPYEISSYNSLMKLAQAVNSEERNGLITSDTHFRQTCKIDLYQASREIDRRYGWLPIGANSALPFRGHYHGAPLSTMIIDRPNSAAVGLFGYVHNAAFDNITLGNSSVSGNFAAGGIVGAALMSGKDRGLVAMTDCKVEGCEINGSDESVGIGALIGVVDMQSRACLQNCHSDANTITGSYGAGGLIGGAALYSSVAFSSCANSSDVTSGYSGAGGLIGSCDTIRAAASANSGRIRGAVSYAAGDKKNSGIGAGGLVGGCGPATMTSCSNTGIISGYAGVGGIVGSGRVKGSETEAYMYDNVMFRYCWNDADVSGHECVGGIVGEAQAGTYAVYNKGNVTGTDYVAGIAGCTSIAVTHNAINLGKVDGREYVAGIVGKTQFGSIALDHNYGPVSGTGSHLGGIVALAGNNTMINHCGNFGNLSSTSGKAVGGIVGEIGDPREWTAMNYAECVIGSMEMFMGVLGPFMAMAGHSIESVSHLLEIFLHVAEVSTDTGLLVCDSILWEMGLEEMLEEANITEMSTELSIEVNDINNEIKAAMAALRSAGGFTLKDFDSAALSSGYTGGVESNLAFYEADGGDMRFNEKINLLREEREKALEKSHKTDEIIHQSIAGACILVGAAAAIGGIVVSGGAAVPFVLAGAAASLAGGMNAITKTALEFEENVVIISQCVNAGKIDAPAGGNIGGLVGRLQDNSILRDCLNTGDGPGHGSAYVGHFGNAASMYRCVSLASHKSWSHYADTTPGYYTESCAVWDPDTDGGGADFSWSNCHVYVMRSLAEVSDPSTYKKIDKNWSIGADDSLWKIGSDSPNSFPVPLWSEMTK